jgi:cytoskeletal protein RodZ
MPPETEPTFQAFFAAKLKERGVTLKKLAEATGITPSHLESLAHGKFEDLPSSPYLHGYIIRLGKALDFDGEMWWDRIKKEGLVKNSGPTDALPSNRFLKQSPTRFIWVGVVIALILIYLAFQLPIIFSKPTITIDFPAQNPYTTSSSTLTLEGTVTGANSLALNGDTVTIAPDGSWQETVLLQNGPNTFDISAKKLLSGEADVTEQIFYDAGSPANASSTASSTPPTSQ